MVSSDWLQQWSPDYCPGVNTPHTTKKKKKKLPRNIMLLLLLLLLFLLLLDFFQVVVWTPRLAITAQTC